MDFGFYKTVVHQDKEGFWIALYDTRRELRDNHTALEADLLLESGGASLDEAQTLLREQLGLTPLEAWEPVATRYGHGWRAICGAELRSVAA